MREIKFRAWCIPNKIMLPNVGVHPFITQVTEGLKVTDNGGITISPVMKNYELMQSTGLHDSKGKEIWEGDILAREHFSHWVVIWNKFRFEIYNVCNPQKTYPINYGLWDREAIGNIYENPELLQEAK